MNHCRCTLSILCLHYRFKVAYEREMDHFVSLVLDPTKECAVTRDEVLLCTRVANACERSQREGKMVELEPLPVQHD